MNDSNRYIIVLYGMRAKDFKNLNAIIINGIRETLLAECIKAEIVEQFIHHSPEFVYTKTKDRSRVAKMNKACETVYWYGDSLRADTVNQTQVNIKASTYLVNDVDEGYIHPNERLYKDLEAFANTTIFTCQAVELKITLDLANHQVWRSVIVPRQISFQQLHAVLQVAFDWKDYHLHDFLVVDGDRPIVNVVCNEDAFDYPNDIPMVMEADSKLSDYIPNYSRIKYTYDFGDDWRHYIDVQNMIEDYPQNYPICIAGAGNAPPEDVGGEGGYDEFLEAMADPKHPEHATMREWSSMQWYREFNIELVNRRLIDSLKRL